MSCILSRVQVMKPDSSLICAWPRSQVASARCRRLWCSVRYNRCRTTIMRLNQEWTRRESRVPIQRDLVLRSKYSWVISADILMKSIAIFHAEATPQRKSFWWKRFMNFSNLLENLSAISKSWDKRSWRTSILKVITSFRWSIKSNLNWESITKLCIHSSARILPITFATNSKLKTCCSWFNSTVTTKMAISVLQISTKWSCRLATNNFELKRPSEPTYCQRNKITTRSP